MSTTEPEFSPEDYEGLQPKMAQLHPAELRKLRKEAAKAADLEARLAELERRDIFAQAGIPTSDPAAKYFIKGYDGELTPEAIRAAAIEARVMPATTTTPAEQAAHEAATNAAAGSIPPNANPDVAAQLAEMSRKNFAPTDDTGVQAHIAGIAKFARDNQLRIPVT